MYDDPNGRTVRTAGFSTILTAGGTITNGSADDATAALSNGVSLSGAGTLTNFGAIGATSSGVAVAFAESDDRLVEEGSGSISGTVNGGGGVLELAAAAGNGVIYGLGSSITNFASLAVDAGAQWTFFEYNTVASGETLKTASEIVVQGTLVNSGTLSAGAAIELQNSGELINVSGATLTLAPVGVVNSAGAAVMSGALAVVGAVEVTPDGVTVSSGAVISGDNAFILGATVLDGGTLGAAGTPITIGDALTVSSGGVASGLVLKAGAVDIYAGGAVESNVTLSKGATLELGGVHIASASFIVDGPVDNRTTVQGVTLLSGAALETRNAVVSSGGVLVVAYGGEADGTTVSKGGVERLDSGGTASGATVHAGGVLSGSGNLLGVIVDSGVVSGGRLVSGAELAVRTGGDAQAVRVVSGGALVISRGGVARSDTLTAGATLSIAAGATAYDVAIAAGDTVIDGGSLVYDASGAVRFEAALSGSGSLVEAGTGVLDLLGGAGAFDGKLVLSAGKVELAKADSIGAGSVIAFVADGKTETLVVSGADRPANGGAFVNALDDFDSSTERLDLANRAYVSGATATLSGKTLTLHDGAYTAAFTLKGDAAAGYVVVSDGAGGTLIRAKASPAGAMIHAIAGFDAEPAASALIDAFSLQSAHFTLGAEPSPSRAARGDV